MACFSQLFPYPLGVTVLTTALPATFTPGITRKLILEELNIRHDTQIITWTRWYKKAPHCLLPQLILIFPYYTIKFY